RMLVASPAYLARLGTPKSPEDLHARNAILYSNRESDWRFPGNDAGNGVVIRPRKLLRVNNGLIMRDAALAGLGITLLPTFLIRPELDNGALRVVNVGVEAESA